MGALGARAARQARRSDRHGRPRQRLFEPSDLRSFPFNRIKIDRSFVADLVGTSDALSIVQATIQLSQKLGMEITAEGVETAEQLQTLAREGCTLVQGFHIGRPVPAGEVDQLLNFYAAQEKTRTHAAG